MQLKLLDEYVVIERIFRHHPYAIEKLSMTVCREYNHYSNCFTDCSAGFGPALQYLPF